MKVFISYRRQDNMYLPAQLRDELASCLGDQDVFLDVDSIPIGVDFSEHIRSWVSRSDVMLALIGPNWRPDLLTDIHDFVRIELLSADDLGKVVVPVLHSNQRMPGHGDVPGELEWLLYRNAFGIRPPPDHREDLRRLAAFVVSLELERQGADGNADPSRADANSAVGREASLDFISRSDRTTALRGRLRRLVGRGGEGP